MNTEQLDKLHEFDFWSMINGVSWGTNTTKCSTAKRYIMYNFPPYKTNAFRRLAEKYTTQLVDAYLSKINSVFSYTDIYNAANEVVGYGKPEYNRYIDDPLLLTGIIESLLNKDEDEKFVYAMPLEDDFYNQNVL